MLLADSFNWSESLCCPSLAFVLGLAVRRALNRACAPSTTEKQAAPRIPTMNPVQNPTRPAHRNCLHLRHSKQFAVDATIGSASLTGSHVQGRSRACIQGAFRTPPPQQKNAVATSWKFEVVCNLYSDEAGSPRSICKPGGKNYSFSTPSPAHPPPHRGRGNRHIKVHIRQSHVLCDMCAPCALASARSRGMVREAEAPRMLPAGRPTHPSAAHRCRRGVRGGRGKRSIMHRQDR